MTPTPHVEPDPIVVPLEWEDVSIGRVTLECRFTVERMRHVVNGHFDGLSEPWDRLMPRELIERLVLRSNDGDPWLPPLDDFRAFVELIAAAMQECCRRPMLCLCSERVLATMRDGIVRPERHSVAVPTIVFVLRSGASAYVKLDQGQTTECPRVSGRLASCYFPRGRGWESPRRAHVSTASRLVRQWVEHCDRQGRQRLPTAGERVIFERGDKMMERSGVRFVTPDTWGFVPSGDDRLVFQWVPSWKP